MLFLLSGERADALVSAIDALRTALTDRDAGLGALARAHGRCPSRTCRVAIVADTAEELATRLDRARDRLLTQAEPRARDKAGLYFGFGPHDGAIAVLFPGQGSQFPRMTVDLWPTRPALREGFAALDRAFVAAGVDPPTALLLPREGEPPDPRLFALETGAELGLMASLGLYDLLVDLGVRADAFAGHSNGEHAALIAAGVLAFDSIDDIAAHMYGVANTAEHLPAPASPEGALAVTGIGADAVEPLLEAVAGDAFVAVDNCPTQCLIAGYLPALDRLAGLIATRGGIASRLPFARAHHTTLFRDWSALLDTHYAIAPMRPAPAWPRVYSCMTAAPYPADPDAVRRLLTEQWSNRVRFRETIEALYAGGVRTFVEAGPDSKLTAFVDDTLRRRPHRAVSASSASRGDRLQLLHCVAELYAAGLPIHADALDESSGAKRVDVTPSAMPPALAALVLREHQATVALASASLERVAARLGVVASPSPPAHHDAWRLLGRIITLDAQRLRATRQWTTADAFVGDHSLARHDTHGASGLAVLPFTVMMEVAAEAACALTGGAVVALRDMRALSWLALENGALTLRVDADAVGSSPSGLRAVRVRLVGDAGVAFDALVDVHAAPPAALVALTPPHAPRRVPTWSAETFYNDYVFHGPAFRAIRAVVHAGADGVEAELAPMATGSDEDQPLLDFVLLDCAGQLAALWRIERTGEKVGAFPFAARALRVAGGRFRPQDAVRCRGTVSENAFGVIASSFDFLDGSGRVLATLDGFEQRVVRLPDDLWARLFGPDPIGVPLSDTTGALLAQPGSIWARALAHVMLDDRQRAEWYATPDADTRAQWLLARS